MTGSLFRSFAAAAAVVVSALALMTPAAGQAVSTSNAQVNIKVTQVDAVAFKKLLKPNGRPLLINFWATWCEPCREEFPDLVKIDQEYRDKIDFITVTLDFPEEKDAAVPRFLREMKATMPSYLLVTQDETAAIAAVSKDWAGALPFTVLYNNKGGLSYFRQGKVSPAVLRAELNKLLTPPVSEQP